MQDLLKEVHHEDEDKITNTDNGTKKEKKIQWNKIDLNNTLSSKNTYALRCAEGLISSMEKISKPSIFLPGALRPPSSYYSNIRYYANAISKFYFSPLVLNKVEKDNDSSVIFEQNGFNYLFHHPGTSIKCSFCDTDIPTMDAKNAVYIRESNSPWFFYCEGCGEYMTK